MGSTRKTDPDMLSQYDEDDKPSWLEDYNRDMKSIQSALNAIRGRLDEMQAQINTKAAK